MHSRAWTQEKALDAAAAESLRRLRPAVMRVLRWQKTRRRPSSPPCQPTDSDAWAADSSKMYSLSHILSLSHCHGIALAWPIISDCTKHNFEVMSGNHCRERQLPIKPVHARLRHVQGLRAAASKNLCACVCKPTWSRHESAQCQQQRLIL